MNNPYTPWQPQQGYPDMSDPSSMEELAQRRMQGNIRQRRGQLPSIFDKIMQLFRQGQQPPINQQPPLY